MRPRVQFSLRSLMVTVAGVAVVLSAAQIVGGGPIIVATGLAAAVLILALVCQPSDAALVPAALCGVLAACLIGFPPLVVDPELVDLWQGTLVVAVLWDIVAHRATPPGVTARFDYRRRRERGAIRRFELPVIVAWVAIAAMGLSVLLLLGAGGLAATAPFRREAAQAWQTWRWTYAPDRLLVTTYRSIIGTWSVHALLVLALVPAIRLRRRPEDHPDAEVLLRQVASAHALALLALGVTTLRVLMESFNVMSGPPRAIPFFFPPLFYLAGALPSLVLLSAALFLVLGTRAALYFRRHGWLLALGVGAVALAVAVFVGAGVVVYPELR